MVSVEATRGLLPESYKSGARTWQRGASRSMSERHCVDELALACRQTTPAPLPASRTWGKAGHGES
jgi:hypothetical protein